MRALNQTSTRGVSGAGLACVALLLTAACGLAPQPDSDGVRVRDGVAPFSDQGSLQFCIGTQRLLPSVERQGLCRADEQVPAAVAVHVGDRRDGGSIIVPAVLAVELVK